MRPVGMDIDRGEYYLMYRCEKCSFKRRKKTEKEDNFDEIIKISKN
jgi:hypothetical protein